MTWRVRLSGMEIEVFEYDTLEEAIAGVGRLAHESAICTLEDGIAREITVEIGYCTHRDNEYCMICTECGHCSESLDDDDVCGDCR